MSDERLAALLNDLLSDEEDALSQGGKSNENPDFDFASGTQLFEEEELETALLDLEGHETSEPPQRDTMSPTERSPFAKRAMSPKGTSSHDSVDSGVEATVQSPIVISKLTEEATSSPLASEEPTNAQCQMNAYPELQDVRKAVCKVWKADDLEIPSTVLERVKRALLKAEDDWNPEGRPDACGGMIGGSVALQASSANDPMSKALQNQARYGTPLVSCCAFVLANAAVVDAQVICERLLRGSSLMTAIGTSRGLVIIQLRSSSLPGPPTYELFELTDAKGLGTISSLAFSHFSDKEKLLLAVGSTEGTVSVWDISSRKCIVSMGGHTGAVHSLTFVGGKTQCALVSADSNGALYAHTLTSWVVRTSLSTRVLSEGNKQPLLVTMFPPTRSVDDNDDTSMPSIADSGSSFGEGMVCLCHPNICSIGRLSSEGRLSVFYQIPKPVTVTNDVMAVAVWCPLGKDITFAPHPNPDMDGRIPCGVLAIAWEKQLSLLNIPLLGDPSPDRPNIRQLPHHMETSDWVRIAHEIHITNKANWESSGSQAICLYMGNGGALRGVIRKRGILSQFLLFDSLLNLLDRVEIDDCPLSCPIQTDPAEICTSVNSVSASGASVTLLGSMVMKTCRLLEWSDSISILASIKKWMMALHLLAAFYCQASQQDYCAGVGCAQLGVRDVSMIHKYTADVVINCLNWALETGQPEHLVSLHDIAELLMDNGCCVEVLFHDLFSRFVASEAKDVYLEKLEKSLVSNELQARVPPEVMQSLVEYCCEIGEPEKVERCVLRMDISSLDLNQVIPLCIEHHLFTALLSIFNNALLQDCITPAKYLVAAIFSAQTKEEVHDHGMKLLLYLHCCLFGDSYPPGKEEIDVERARKIKQQILAFVLFTTASDLDKSCQAVPSGDQVGSKRSQACAAELSNPYPVLCCILSVHAPLVFRLLKNSLVDWECMEKDLLEAYSGGAVEEMTRVRTVTQVIVDALVDLMGSFPMDKDLCLAFLCHCVSSGRAVVSPATAMVFLEHLSTTSKGKESSEYVETEEEIQFCGIVRGVGVEPDSSRESAMKLTYLEGKKALGLATNANMLVAAALLHHLFQDYKSALEYHIKTGNNSAGGCFAYFEASISHFLDYRNTTEVERLKSAVLSCMSELATVDPESTASMVMRHFPDNQEAVIQGLCGSRELLFKYLKSSMDAALSQTEVSLSSDGNQLLTKPHCTLYVNLMCEYDPTNVLPFLRTYDHLVDVHQCKQDCMRSGLKEGAAHLLEREGDVVGALNVLIEKIESANRDMERAILARSLDSLDTALSRQLSLSAILTVSSTPDARIHQLPEEVGNSQSSLATAVMLCRRNSLERDRRSEADEKRRQETLKLWSSLIELYIEAFKDLPNHIKKQKRSSHAPSGFYHKGIIKRNDRFHDYPRIAFLRDIYAALVDEVISAMADYVPLMDAARLVITEHSQDSFGDFRSTLLSFINAYNYEQSILTSVGKLLSADAYRALIACYKTRSKALPIKRQPLV